MAWYSLDAEVREWTKQALSIEGKERRVHKKRLQSTVWNFHTDDSEFKHLAQKGIVKVSTAYMPFFNKYIYLMLKKMLYVAPSICFSYTYMPFFFSFGKNISLFWSFNDTQNL